ncbi:MAG TPA: glycosyltransferase family 2 protein [Polyangia bacterium]|nr:glycosyltransferase family 2 protein [Polyangia bacterium]
MGGLVSVVMPAYNRAHCITRSIDSVLNQSYPDVEVIVHDDGSTDGTAGLLADRYGSNPRVRVQRAPNAGVSAARNQAFKLVRGDYVALLDSDDVFYPWKLEVQLACLRHAPQIGMVWTDMRAQTPDGKLVEERYLKVAYTNWRRFTNESIFSASVPLAQLTPQFARELGSTRLWTGDIFDAMLMGTLVHTSTVLLTRERFEKVKYFREDLKLSGEDYDFHLRTCREGPVGFADVVSIIYEVGAADRLTRPAYKVQTALNFLNTVLPMIEAERARIRLPEKMIREVTAEAHRWYAEELALTGQSATARPHFVKALKLEPKLRTAALLGLAYLPEPARGRLRQVTRTLRSLLPARRGGA